MAVIPLIVHDANTPGDRGFEHAVGLIENDGLIDIVDPQTGEVSQAIDHPHDVEDFLTTLAEESYEVEDVDPIWTTLELPLNPAGFAGFEPPPFYTSTDMLLMLDWALQELGLEDTIDYLPDDATTLE